MAGLVFIKTGVIILMIVFSSLHTTETQCNETREPTFGQECSYYCHCVDNEQCDFTTGNCSKGCDFAWVGPACQRRNVIHIKNIFNANYVARHSSNTENNVRWAPLAIDKNLNSCSHTNYAQMSTSNPWWRVWLAEKYTIRHLLIVTDESATEYFKGFTVTIGNVSYNNRFNGIFDNSTVCYTHTSTSPETKTIHVNCSYPVIGNQVKIKLASKNTQLVLCDVRIYGECQEGTFGETCTERCSPHCKDICDKTNGTCTACESRWAGSRCDKMVNNIDEETHIRQAYITVAATVAVCILVMSVTIALCCKKNAIAERVCPKTGKRGESFFYIVVYENMQTRDAYDPGTLEHSGINTQISEKDACGTGQVGNFYETLKRNTDVDRTYEKCEILTV